MKSEFRLFSLFETPFFNVKQNAANPGFTYQKFVLTSEFRLFSLFEPPFSNVQQNAANPGFIHYIGAAPTVVF